MQAGLSNNGTMYGLSGANGDEQRSGEIMWSRVPLRAEMSETRCPRATLQPSAHAPTCARSERLAAACWIRATTGQDRGLVVGVTKHAAIPRLQSVPSDAACLNVSCVLGERMGTWQASVTMRCANGRVRVPQPL